MPTRLFDDRDHYTEEAMQIDREAGALIDALFAKYAHVSRRDLAGLLTRTVADSECKAILDLDSK